MNVFELKQQRQFALDKADKIIAATEGAGRKPTTAESLEVESLMTAVRALTPQIDKSEKQFTLREQLVNGKLLGAGMNLRQGRTPNAPVTLSEDYYNSFFTWLGTRGQQMDAALYEGTGSAGGFVVPTITDTQVIPLAPSEMGVRSIATVIPTANDLKLPQQATFSTAALKAESGSSTNTFTESDPSLASITLSAFMAGVSHTLSWELVQDVPSFQQFAVTDGVLALQMLEEGFFVSGTGTGQAQGLLGNVGTGITGVVVGTDNYASELLTATFDVLGKLNVAYFNSNTRWLLNRATATALRKAQMQSNLFVPVFTSQGGKDYLHGIEVAYSSSMPVIAAGATPVLLGDFKSGYVIGDRGGSGINVKILDQPLATAGQLILLFYRRLDGRVRRSEAIQGITLHT